MARISDIIGSKIKQNYSAGYHYATGLLNKLYRTVDYPLKVGADFDAMAIHEYIRKWVAVCKEYKELGKCVN
jgi:L-rhamnose mutarotase